MEPTHHTIATSDGLNLHIQDSGGDRPVVLCLHGLTRNCRDFDTINERLTDRYRMIAIDQRGRGRSDWDPDPTRYQVGTYVADTLYVLQQLAIDSVIVVGTSMGGLMGMLIAAMPEHPVRALVLNDVGPELDPAGLQRIQQYVGETPVLASWEEAAAAARRNNEAAFPSWGEDAWMRFAKKLFHESDTGIVPSYDPAISAPLRADTATAVPPDLWPIFEAGRDLPTLLLRGELSDILAAGVAQRMKERHPRLTLQQVGNTGHAPMLDEPDAWQALDQFLRSLP